MYDFSYALILRELQRTLWFQDSQDKPKNVLALSLVIHKLTRDVIVLTQWSAYPIHGTGTTPVTTNIPVLV